MIVVSTIVVVLNAMVVVEVCIDMEGLSFCFAVNELILVRDLCHVFLRGLWLFSLLRI